MIHIVQCLCPSRHCLAALAYDPAGTPPFAAEMTLARQIERAIFTGEIGPRCAICGAQSFHYEHGETRFATMEEAVPALLECQEEQRRTLARLEAERQ